MTELIRECIGTLISRRQGLRWLLVSAVAGSGLSADRAPVAAKRKKHKHKRPKPEPPQPPTPSLAECRATCGDRCDCLYTSTGDIHCGAIADFDCNAPCRTGSDCPFGTCIASVIPAGGDAAEFFDCDYRFGVCADEVACVD
jgi:hypothetical protein